MDDVANNWPHQTRGRQMIAAKRAAGVRSVIGVAPCGAGKSRVMAQEAIEEVNAGGNVRIYLHRSFLLQQLSANFEAAGIAHGVQAAGYPMDESAPIQLCMMDSVYSRAVKRSTWDLGEPTKVMIDEAHNQTSNKARAVVYGGKTELGSTWQGHFDRGAFILGFSATPVDCGDFYSDIVDFGSYKEMRAVKAHLPVRVYSPSEIDTVGLTRQGNYEFSPKDLEERSYKIFGDAYQSWKKLNPDGLPAILFAPSVPASRWFAEEWAKFGVPVAHIDGEACLVPRRCVLTGAIYLEQYDNDASIRSEIMEMSRTGEIAVLCNRFVLREAIDMPWLYHGINATAFGGLSSYLQSVGRIQRFWGDYPYKILQDHGGNYWRHGSPNMDRIWELGCTNATIAKARVDLTKKLTDPADLEGICCPKCFCWRQHGIRCPNCGHSHKQSVRRVVSLEGELKLMRGVVNKPKKAKPKDANHLWISVIYGSVAHDRPASSAVAIWAARCREAGVVPKVSELKNPPPSMDSPDWHRSMRSLFPWAKRKGKEQ